MWRPQKVWQVWGHWVCGCSCMVALPRCCSWQHVTARARSHGVGRRGPGHLQGPMPGLKYGMVVHWQGNTGPSYPHTPPWISMTGPITAWIMALHSMCHPGRPRPQGDSQLGSSGLAAFQRAKSAGPRLRSSTATRSPALCGCGACKSVAQGLTSYQERSTSYLLSSK